MSLLKGAQSLQRFLPLLFDPLFPLSFFLFDFVPFHLDSVVLMATPCAL